MKISSFEYEVYNNGFVRTNVEFEMTSEEFRAFIQFVEAQGGRVPYHGTVERERECDGSIFGPTHRRGLRIGASPGPRMLSKGGSGE